MARTAFSIAKAVANLVEYGEAQLKLTVVDKIYAQNQLLALFGISEPEAPNYTAAMELQTKILDPIIRYAIKNNMIAENESLLFETKLMGLITPSAGLVVSEFDNIASYYGIQKATDYLNDLSIKSNYIRMADINKNIRWTAPGELGDLTITINLSKPEKDNKQVALEKSLPQSSYPKCMLCAENLGFNGTLRHPARQTLRIVPLLMNNENWFLQYSPYVYYDNHCIAFSAEHRPMAVTPQSFHRLFDFVEQIPHYFMGSNADLPIVGGSILAHDHFQGGSKVLPMLKRAARQTFSSEAYPDVNICILDWYNSVIKLNSFNRKAVEELGAKALANWRSYNDPEQDIASKTADEPHNTITPVTTFDNEEGYSLYLILRNNRTDKEHPYGIFHPTEDMHNIKKEGIGLIEAMGIFILPGRLFNETKAIESILTGETALNFAELSDEKHPLSKHLHMIAQLCNDYGTALTPEKAEKVIVEYINNTCVKILNCTAVFKNTELGQKGFQKFLLSIGIR